MRLHEYFRFWAASQNSNRPTTRLLRVGKCQKWGITFQKFISNESFSQAFSTACQISENFLPEIYPPPPNPADTLRSAFRGTGMYNRTIREGAGAWRACLSVGSLD
jgi:hypothetical protein